MPRIEKEVPDILREAAETFAERNLTYGATYKKMGILLHTLFDGRPPKLETPDDWTKFHLVIFEVAKLVRFVQSDLTHVDSVHDSIVYSAMIEECLK